MHRHARHYGVSTHTTLSCSEMRPWRRGANLPGGTKKQLEGRSMTFSATTALAVGTWEM